MIVYLEAQSQRAREWFLKCACPIWLERGVDWKNGGFFDSLDPLHARNASDRKRLRVATRQIFVFSCALDLGFEDGRRAVTHGLEFLFEHARHPDGGFTSDFDLSLAKTSERRDSYDLAFVILALAHSYRHLRDVRLLDEALALAHFFENRLRHPTGGFIEGLPAQLPRRQNPHMHLLEACIAWIPHDRTGTFERLAVEIIDLLATRFLIPKSGAVLEYFNEDWSQPPHELSDCVEPGHLYEWCWLLNAFEEMTGNRVSAGEQIYKFADQFGSNKDSGLLFGEISVDGKPRTASVRLWPHAERVHAELDHIRRHPEAGSSKIRTALDNLWRFLDCPTSGLWLERFDAETRRFAIEPAPASSLYHIVGALSALLKMSGELSASPVFGSEPKRSRFSEHAQ